MSKKQSHQAFTKVEMFPTNWMGKATGKKPVIMKCKLDTGASVNIMPLFLLVKMIIFTRDINT